jgi:hypothetical protein
VLTSSVSLLSSEAARNLVSTPGNHAACFRTLAQKPLPDALCTSQWVLRTPTDIGRLPVTKADGRNCTVTDCMSVLTSPAGVMHSGPGRNVVSTPANHAACVRTPGQNPLPRARCKFQWVLWTLTNVAIETLSHSQNSATLGPDLACRRNRSAHTRRFPRSPPRTMIRPPQQIG